jgi:hypothetical protein
VKQRDGLSKSARQCSTRKLRMEGDWIRRSSACSVLLLWSTVCGWAQQPRPPAAAQSDAMAAAINDLQQQVSALREAVAEVRDEAAQYRTETAELKRELQATREQLATTASPGATASPRGTSSAQAATSDQTLSSPPQASPGSLADRVAALEDSAQLLNGKIDEQYQTKVASASRYRVRLSGIVLMNLFDNRGTTDNQDIPSWASPTLTGMSDRNFGATLRQSEIGLEVFGPTLAGAKLSGSLQADFAGGFPNTWNGVNYGQFRLRTASARMDWEDTSIVVGQDNLFLSPLSPSSFASLAVPAFNYAGNLWGWIPQVRVEHRFDVADGQRITLQAGILDNLTADFPADSYFRAPQAGESSGQPGYGFRTAWGSKIFGQAFTLGVAGYYGRQYWRFGHHRDGWAGMTDWEIPLAPRLSLSGEFYRGRAVGGLGGGISQSVLYNGDPSLPTTAVSGLDSIGGWSQLKLRANAKLEFNAGYGLDNPTAEEARAFAAGQAYTGPTMTENRGALVNFIYRPRSNLLFSTEYRHLRTTYLDDNAYSAEQVNVMMGILF